MTTIGQSRKAVSLVLAGLPVWGAAATAENGIDQGEWWALVSLLMGAVVVWITPNDKPAEEEPEMFVAPRYWSDNGLIQWGLLATLLLLVLILHWLHLIP